MHEWKIEAHLLLLWHFRRLPGWQNLGCLLPAKVARAPGILGCHASRKATRMQAICCALLQGGVDERTIQKYER